MQKIHLEVDNNLEKDQELWRYMNLAKFVSMLEKNAIWLARADTFKDKHEGRIPSEMRKAIELAYQTMSSKIGTVKDADDFQEHLIKNTFISCWHKNSEENLVMWEIYGHETEVVTVKTSVGKLEESIDLSKTSGNYLQLKNVTYQKHTEISGIIPYEECAFYKRPHFSFEQEVRLSLDTYSTLNPTKNTPYGHYIPICLNNLIEQVIIHPDASNWFVDVINSLMKKYNIHAKANLGLCGSK